jgi:hypothetical protein
MRHQRGDRSKTVEAMHDKAASLVPPVGRVVSRAEKEHPAR